ncbi:MAG: SRPBCC family protein [Acidimicrobiales bacterium]
MSQDTDGAHVSASSTSSSTGGPASSSIDLSVDAETVWHALVTDGGLEPWMGEGSTIDPEVDGALHLVDLVGGRPRSGRVDRVEDRACLEFTWWPDHRPIERTKVSIQLTPIESGTRVTVTESLPRSTQVSSGVKLSVGSTTGVMRGAWLWRLAVLSLATQVAKV